VGKTHVASHATKQGGDDIAKSLRDLEMIPIGDNRPEREMSKREADKGKAKEQSGMDIFYQEELRRYLLV